MAHAHDRSRAGVVPFWAHQLAELLLGGLLLVEGARTGEHTAVLAGAGAALMLLALMSDGAFGAWRGIGRRLHRVLDLVAAVALALLPLVLSLDGVLGIVVLEAAALGMAWLALRTNWSERGRRRSTRRAPATGAPKVTPAPDVTSPTATPSPAPGGRPSGSPPRLARTLGAAAGKARADAPRHLGRAVGRLRRAARATGDPTPPTRPDPALPPPGDRTTTDPG